MKINNFFLFLLNKVFVAARKQNTKRNKIGFILYACDTPPLNSNVKKKVLHFFSTLCFIASIKNNKQNKRENIVQYWFYETSIKILCAQLTNPHPQFC